MKEIIINKNEKKELNISIDESKDFLIILNENAELNLVTNLINNKDLKISFEIILKENSKLNYINLQNLPLVEHFTNKKVKLEKNSVFNYYELNFGSKSTYSETIVNLDGENAKFEHYGIFASNKEQKFDFNLHAIHNAQNTHSNMLTRGALNDSSKSNYNGLIRINKNASNSNGYQKQETILLNEKAESKSVPKLEINNNDVRCTHGSSNSQIDEDKLFYLMSRGLNEEEAKLKIIEGFFEHILSKINLENMDKIKEIIYNKIK